MEAFPKPKIVPKKEAPTTAADTLIARLNESLKLGTTLAREDEEERRGMVIHLEGIQEVAPRATQEALARLREIGERNRKMRQGGESMKKAA